MKKKQLYELILKLEKRIEQLEKSISETRQVSDQLRPIGPGLIPDTVYIPTVFGPIDLCVDYGYHEYPNPWHGVTPPSCKKCGKQGSTWTVTCSSISATSDQKPS